VLRLNGQLLIKRLQSDLAKGLFVKSDNPQYALFISLLIITLRTSR
jgi:phage repressor protein C with HTH and peptisase S24 domain